MKTTYEIHFTDKSRTKRVVLKNGPDGSKIPHAFITWEGTCYKIVKMLADGIRVRNRKSYAEARQTACRAN